MKNCHVFNLCSDIRCWTKEGIRKQQLCTSIYLNISGNPFPLSLFQQFEKNYGIVIPTHKPTNNSFRSLLTKNWPVKDKTYLPTCVWQLGVTQVLNKNHPLSKHKTLLFISQYRKHEEQPQNIPWKLVFSYCHFLQMHIIPPLMHRSHRSTTPHRYLDRYTVRNCTSFHHCSRSTQSPY